MTPQLAAKLKELAERDEQSEHLCAAIRCLEYESMYESRRGLDRFQRCEIILRDLATALGIRDDADGGGK